MSNAPVRRRTPVAMLLGALFCAPAATAAISDTFQPFVGTSYSYDDNLFRLADDRSPVSDTTKLLVAGVAFQYPLGRQVFGGSAKVTRVSFTRFGELDYNGKDASLNWNWQLGNHLSGTAGATYSESLPAFSDFHTNERNIRTSRGQYAEANWRFHPSWQVHGKLSKDEFAYALTSQRYLDRNENRGEVGFDYLAASGSTIGLQLRHLNDRYPNPLVFGGLVDDEGFKQDELQLKVLWKFSAVTQAQFLGGRAKREHNLFSQRDSSGVNGRLDVNWSPREALKLVVSGWHEFQPFEGSIASYSLSKGASAAATWYNTSKIQTQASLRYAKRDFAGLLFANPLLQPQDRTRNATIGVTYLLTHSVQLGATAYHESRDGGAGFSSQYRARGASLNANIQF